MLPGIRSATLTAYSIAIAAAVKAASVSASASAPAPHHQQAQQARRRRRNHHQQGHGRTRSFRRRRRRPAGSASVDERKEEGQGGASTLLESIAVLDVLGPLLQQCFELDGQQHGLETTTTTTTTTTLRYEVDHLLSEIFGAVVVGVATVSALQDAVKGSIHPSPSPSLPLPPPVLAGGTGGQVVSHLSPSLYMSKDAEEEERERETVVVVQDEEKAAQRRFRTRPVERDKRDASLLS
ncbi:hypothetical protein OC834_001187 [Tilletia horrida]|nr:hypothetical protein OC834_001187 [Tilletia horrida]